MPTKIHIVKDVVFPVVMYGSENAEELMLLNCGVGEDFVSPLDNEEIKSVNPKGNQSQIFIGRTDTEPEAPKLFTLI